MITQYTVLVYLTLEDLQVDVILSDKISLSKPSCVNNAILGIQCDLRKYFKKKTYLILRNAVNGCICQTV